MVKYIAKINIGDYEKGSEVPESVALVWINMYKESPIEVVKSVEKVVEVKKLVKKVSKKKK
jgi:hypothetical protein